MAERSKMADHRKTLQHGSPDEESHYHYGGQRSGNPSRAFQQGCACPGAARGRAWESIAQGRPTASTEACIERAWAAWQLDGSTDKQIPRVAQLIETAHRAIRSANENALGQEVKDVADVIWAGLPRSAKPNTSFDKVVQIVRALRQEPDPRAAAVSSTAKILGWYDANRAHAAHAIRVALMASRGA